MATAGGSTTPAGKTDCPRYSDPLASRQGPAVGACDFRDRVVRGPEQLSPGVYCGGLTIESGGVATLLQGDFVIKDGPLLVKDGAVLTGAAAGFYFTGSGAVLDIATNTEISLVAPVTGPLAGMLFFEDRANAPGLHKMASRFAPLMLGTFYFPKSRLEVGARVLTPNVGKAVGQLSAWTIVIAGQVKVGDGLNLVLNTNYDQTDVPVPDGASGGRVSLVR